MLAEVDQVLLLVGGGLALHRRPHPMRLDAGIPGVVLEVGDKPVMPIFRQHAGFVGISVHHQLASVSSFLNGQRFFQACGHRG